jgi:hypothetical protein
MPQRVEEAMTSRQSGTGCSAWSRCVLAQTEATNVYVEGFRMLHVTEVSSLSDYCKLGAGNGGVQLLCDVHRTTTIHVAPQQQRGHLNPRRRSRVSVSADEIDIRRKPTGWNSDMMVASSS